MILRPLPLVALLVGGALMTSWSWRPIPAAAAAEKPAVVIHESVWDAGERDSWSAFTIRVSSERGFDGQLLLTPTRGQQPRAVPPVDRAAPQGPTIRTDLTLEPGVERLVTAMAPVSESAYRAEVRDPGGRLVFAGQARQALTRATYNVGLLIDRKGGDAVFEVGAQLPLSVSRRFRSAADFPADPLLLADLKAIVVADFDSATLSTEQGQALQTFVAHGGKLLVTGGESATRTLSALPEALVPLRHQATAPASLSPLVELVGEITTATTAVITGPLRSGRVVVGGAKGPPLVVEAEYGRGRIIQFAYDPFAVIAEQKTGAPAFRTLPWSVGVLRAAAGHQLVQNVPADPAVSPPSPGWAALDQRAGPDPGTGGGAGLLLLAYPFLMAGAVVFAGRKRGAAAWPMLALPALAVVVVAAVLPVDWGLRASTLTGDEVTIERIGPTDAPALVESFHRLVPSRTGHLALRLASGSLATTAPAPRPPRSLPEIPFGGAAARSASGDVVARGENTVELKRLVAWEDRRLHTLASTAAGGWLEARLRLEEGRMVGTVTNRGDRPVRRMRVQAPDGARAELAADVPAGASVQVDAPFGPGGPLPAGDVEAALLEAAAKPAAGRALRPGTLMAVGLLPDQPSIASQNGYRTNSASRAVATPVELEASDSFSLDFGVARLVCCGLAAQGPQVFELRLPTGMTGPFALAVLAGPASPGTAEAAVYEEDTPQPAQIVGPASVGGGG